MAKTLAELFNKYLPTPEQSTVLSGAVATHVKVDKENRLLEVKASFKYIIPKNELYEIEASVAAAYELNHCKILPQYPSVLFSERDISFTSISPLYSKSSRSSPSSSAISDSRSASSSYSFRESKKYPMELIAP